MLLIQSYIIFIQKLKEKLCELIHKGKTDTQEFVHLNLTLIQVNRIFNYISCGNWAGLRTREVFTFWIDAHYDYEEAAQRYRMPVQTVQQLIKEADKALSKKIGKSMELIISGKLHDGTMQFYSSIGRTTRSKKRSITKKEG